MSWMIRDSNPTVLRRSSRLTKLLLKAGITILLLVLLVTFIDVPRLRTALADLNWNWMVAALVLQYVGMVVSSAKLRVLLRAHGLDRTLGEVFKTYLAAGFLGQFLPGSVGGDIYKFLHWRSAAPSHAGLLAAILAERLSGLYCMVGCGLIGVVLSPSMRSLSGLWPLLMLLFLAMSAAWLLVARIAPGTAPLSRPSLDGIYRKHFARLHAALHAMSRDGQLCARVLLLSAVFQICVWSIFSVSQAALGLRLGVWDLLALQALMNLTVMIPVTINGIGLREWAFALLLGLFSATREQAIAYSVFLYASTLISQLPGVFCIQSSILRARHTD